MWTKKKSIFFYLDKNIPYPAKCYPTNNVHFEGNENKCEYNHVGYVIYYVEKKNLKLNYILTLQQHYNQQTKTIIFKVVNSLVNILAYI